jgi:cell division protein FtsQ
VPSASRRPIAPTAGARPRRPLRGKVLIDDATARHLGKLRLRRALLVLAVASFLPALTALYLSPFFRVGEIRVEGAQRLDSEELRQLASLDGDSMLGLDTGGAHERISYLPLVKSASVERRWPNSVSIRIEEREPWGYWQVGEQKYTVDTEGTVLADLPPPEGAPTVTDLTNPVRLVPGDHVDLDAVALARLLVARTPEVLSWSPSAFEFSADKGLVLISDTGYRVVVGDSQNIDYKLAVWKKIEERLGREAMAGHVLDLRFENRPAFQ